MPSPLERFFGGPWNWFIGKVKWVIFLVVIAWAAFAIWRAILMGPLTETENYLPESHYLSQAFDMADKYYAGDDESAIKVHLMFGIKGIDKDGVGIWDPSELGKLEYDDNFDLTTAVN